MQVICSGCNAKIKVPDKAAGKRIKCPRCAIVIQVPAAETPESSEKPPMPGFSPKGLPPGKDRPPLDEPPDETEDKRDDESDDDTAVSEKPSAGGNKLSTIKSSRGGRDRDEDDDEDDAPKKSRARDDDEDEDDDRPSKRRRDEDDDDDDDRPSRRGRRDDDDDDLDVRKKRRKKKKGATGMALTSMILGIASIVTGVIFCCCCTFGSPLSLILGIAAVITGFMSNKIPGSEGTAMTGIICGFVGIAFGVLGLVLIILSLFFNIGMQGANWNMHQFNQPRPPRPPFR